MTDFETTSQSGASERSPASDHLVRRSLLWGAIAGVSAAIAFLIIRAVLNRAPADPTSERIQSLIDEANRLLRTIDDPKNS